MDELKALFPQPVIVEVSGEPVEIRPLRTRQFGAFAAAVEPLLGAYGQVRADIAAIQALPAEDGEILDWTQAAGRLGADYWVGRIGAHADDLIPALAVALDRPKEWVGDLYLDDLARLVMAVFEANADFFARRMMPAAVEIMERLMPRPAAGGIPATGSSAPGTATSETTP
jgi:hypothetical protein